MKRSRPVARRRRHSLRAAHASRTGIRSVVPALLALALVVPRPALADTVGVEGESMNYTAGSAQVLSDSAASGGQVLALWNNTPASTTGTTSWPLFRVTVRARGDQCQTVSRHTCRVPRESVVTLNVTFASG